MNIKRKEKPSTEKGNLKEMHKKNKKYFDKVEKNCQQIRQDPNCNCVVFHRFFYKHRVRLFEHEKYDILTSDLYL